MLTELAVRNLGVIKELALVFGSGMTAVSGETGSGKTLVVSAINLLLGGRADAGLIRPGADFAEVEGRFVKEGDDNTEVIVRRVIPANGRSRGYINGHLATAAALAEFGLSQVEVHGQHAHQSLLRSDTQRASLDRFGRVNTSELNALAEELRQIDDARAALGGDETSRAREIDLLRYQHDEIESAGLEDPDETEHLEAAIAVLADAAAHREAAALAVSLLDSESGVSVGLDRAVAELSGRTPFEDLTDRLNNAAMEIVDIAAEARNRAEDIDDDPMALAELQSRQQLLAELRRKYGSSLQEVIAFAAATAKRLAELENHEERALELDRQKAVMAQKFAAEQARVRHARRDAAPRLAAAVEAHLHELAMAAARIDIAVHGSAGERVTFRLSANPGHELRPLARAASGGELARAMLALRLVLTSGPPTLVFDEVDAGIGGTAAQAVGSSLAALTDTHQVLVVTHLAQVAAHADHHVLVEKSDKNTDSAGTLAARAQVLTAEQRVVEMSRMLSGSPQSDSARRHAKELLAAVSG